MTHYSLNIKNENTIIDFLEENTIDFNKEILLQVFTCKNTIENIKFLQHILKKHFPNAKIIGSTSSGIVLNDGCHDTSTALSITIFEQTFIETNAIQYSSNSFDMGVDILKAFSSDTLINTKVAIAFADGLNTNGEEFLKGISSINDKLVITGGMAGDLNSFDKTYVFDNENIFDHGCIIAMLVNPNLNFTTSYNFNWQAIGGKHKVTKSYKNRVYEIDGLSATNFYKKYLGDNITQQLPAIVLTFPLIIEQDDLHIARATMKTFDDGSITFSGNVEEGSYVRLGFGNVDMILRKTQKDISKIANEPIEALYVYSCIARKNLLKKDINYELLPLSKIANICGFFTFGEFYHFKNQNHMLNQTMTILGLSEKNESKTNKDIVVEDFEKNYEFLCTQALSEFIKTTTKELEDLNKNLEDRVKQEVQKSREKDLLLEANSRHAQLGEMMEMILHQWRQPINLLSVIISSLRLKNEYSPLPQDEFEKDSDVLEETIRFLNNTIDDFRDFFKVGNKKERIKPKKILDKVNLFISHLLKKHSIKYIEKIDFEDYIYIDSGRFVQVLLNIYKNSIDSIIENKIKEPLISVEVYKKSNYIYFVIYDNAGGVPEDILPKIFEKRFTTKGQHHGTGIGLDMSKTIVEHHYKGTMEAKNFHQGLKTTIKFPIISDRM